MAGQLDTDALVVIADLLGTSAAAGCGGAAVAPTTAPGPVVRGRRQRQEQPAAAHQPAAGSFPDQKRGRARVH